MNLQQSISEFKAAKSRLDNLRVKLNQLQGEQKQVQKARAEAMSELKERFKFTKTSEDDIKTELYRLISVFVSGVGKVEKKLEELVV